MLEGITILSQHSLTLVNASYFIWVTAIFAVVLWLSVVLAIDSRRKREYRDMVSFIAMAVAWVAVFFFIGFSGSLPPRHEYKVLISKDVSLIEFNEKYEIMSQDGLLYTIRDKEMQSHEQ